MKRWTNGAYTENNSNAKWCMQQKCSFSGNIWHLQVFFKYLVGSSLWVFTLSAPLLVNSHWFYSITTRKILKLWWEFFSRYTDFNTPLGFIFSVINGLVFTGNKTVFSSMKGRLDFYRASTHRRSVFLKTWRPHSACTWIWWAQSRNWWSFPVL